MAEPADRSKELQATLEERQDWHVWIIEFGITHFRMRLAIHAGTYPRHISIECIGCIRLEGDLQGGPYHLVLRPIDWHGSPMWELCATNNAFRFVYRRVSDIRRIE